MVTRANHLQALTRCAQLLQRYRFWVEQARRLPIDMASRYRVAAVRWHSHDTGGTYPYARAILAALNVGDSSGSGYNQSVDRLDALDDLLSGVPADLQRRLATIYGTIQLADSVATTSINVVTHFKARGHLLRLVGAARSITRSSSRTLPGHRYASSASDAACDRRSRLKSR